MCVARALLCSRMMMSRALLASIALLGACAISHGDELPDVVPIDAAVRVDAAYGRVDASDAAPLDAAPRGPDAYGHLTYFQALRVGLRDGDCRCREDYFATFSSPQHCADSLYPPAQEPCVARTSREIAYEACALPSLVEYARCLEAGCAAYPGCWDANERALAACRPLTGDESVDEHTARYECFLDNVFADTFCVEEETEASSLGDAVFAGTTVGGGNTRTLPDCGGSPARFHRWRAPSTARFRIDTEGSEFAVALQIRRGCDGEELACALDAFLIGDTTRASATLDFVAGDSVLIVVGGWYSEQFGRYQVNITRL